jgi:hypothetical protein
MISMTSRALLFGLLLVFAGPGRAASLEQFGLDHTLLGGATLASNIYGRGFAVENLNPFGDRGVSTALGEADSGAFIYPYTSGVSEGYFMRGRAFGTVNGRTNSEIGTLSGYRSEYATFFISADFSALGATNLTFQLWADGVLLEETTAPSGEVRVFTESFYNPRANPWWRQANGEFGAAVQFRSGVQASLPNCNASSCSFVYADTLFIRPNGATSVVDHVSRTDVYGGGGLPNFNFDEVRLGMFHHPHAMLGSAKLVATNQVLTVAEIPPGAEDGGGVLAEFRPADSARIELQPVDLSATNANAPSRFEVGASGSLANAYGFLGTLAVANSNGFLGFSAYLYIEPSITLKVFSNAVLVGTSPLGVNDRLRIEGMPLITSAGANADSLSRSAGLFVGFNQQATVTLTNGSQLTGNRFLAEANQPVEMADITGLSLVAHNLSAFTLTGESSTPLDLPRLDIARSGTNVVLRWLDPARAYRLQYKPLVDMYFSQLEIPHHRTNGVTTVEFSLAESQNAYFRLQRYSDSYGD